MYCNRCGREILYGTMCRSCETLNKYQPRIYDTGSRMAGFGKALTATILSTVGFIITYITFLASAFGAYGSTFVGIFISLPLIIIPMIFSIKSITLFMRCKREGMVKPIPTLILGINGLVNSVGAILMAVLSLFFAAIFASIL